MQYRTFGRSGRKVSILGFGAMRIPTHADRTADLEQAVPLLRRGLDLGINYIDTAHGYCEGTSEVAVGQAVKGYDRSQITITTKVPAGDAEKAGAASVDILAAVEALHQVNHALAAALEKLGGAASEPHSHSHTH